MRPGRLVDTRRTSRSRHRPGPDHPRSSSRTTLSDPRRHRGQAPGQNWRPTAAGAGETLMYGLGGEPGSLVGIIFCDGRGVRVWAGRQFPLHRRHRRGRTWASSTSRENHSPVATRWASVWSSGVNDGQRAAHSNRQLGSSPSFRSVVGSPLAARRRKSALEGFWMSTAGRSSSGVVTGTGWYSCVGAPGSLVGRSCCISIGRHYDRRRRSSRRYECWVSSGAICQRGRTGAGQPLPGPQHRRPRRAVLAPSRARAIVVPRQEQGERSFTQSAPWTCPHCRQSAPPGIHE